MDQYEGAWTALGVFLQNIEAGAGIRWLLPHRQLARTIVAIADGFTLGWLVDGDAEAGRVGMLDLARFLESQAAPAPGTDDGPVTPAEHVEGESARTVRHVVEHATLPA